MKISPNRLAIAKIIHALLQGATKEQLIELSGITPKTLYGLMSHLTLSSCKSVYVSGWDETGIFPVAIHKLGNLPDTPPPEGKFTR